MSDLELRRNSRGVFADIFTKAPPSGLSIPDNRGGWYPLIREAFAGAWQANIETPMVDVLSHPTVFACVTLIAGDIAKMRYELVREAADDVWVPTESPSFSPVLRHPNHYQTPLQFKQSWIISKLLYGNTYVLKGRDARGVVNAEYVLDPCRVKPLVSDDGSVFYELMQDRLSTQRETSIIVPGREIIHDLFNPLFHPLVGISPLYAAGIPAILGLKIETNSTRFFGNDSIPSGVLTVPGTLSGPKAQELKAQWEANYGGTNRGRTAIVGDGMKFEIITQPADKSQLNEQWLMASQAIAVAFHVPFYLVGGPMPPYNNIQALNVQYYTQCLQPLIASFEEAQDAGLGLTPDKIGGERLGVQFMLKDLLLMDSNTMMDVIGKGVSAGVIAPNEGRADLNRLPKEGGDTPYLQQQNFSLAALAKRDAMEPQPPAAPANTTPDDGEPQVDDVEASFTASILKEWTMAA